MAPDDAVKTEYRVLQLIHGVLGGSFEQTPSWLVRPGKLECGEKWSLICQLYHQLTGLSLPDLMPPRERRLVDGVLNTGGVCRIIEVDERQHFNRYRAQTLREYPNVPLAFDRRVWIERSESKKELEGGGFGKPRPPLFPDQGGRHRQRAFRDALSDILPPNHGFLPTLRIAHFEVSQWLWAEDAHEKMKAILDCKFARQASAT